MAEEPDHPSTELEHGLAELLAKLLPPPTGDLAEAVLRRIASAAKPDAQKGGLVESNTPSDPEPETHPTPGGSAQP